MPSDQYSVPDVNALGSGGMVAPGAAAYGGFQRELMRRQQQDAEAVALKRQAQQDALDAEVKRAAIANHAAQIANVAENTRAQADARKEANKKLALQFATAGLTPNAPLTDEQAAPIAAIAPNMVGNTPMTAGVPTQFAEAPDAASAPEVPTSVAHTYKGTDADQTNEEHKKFAQRVVDGEFDSGNEALDSYNKARAKDFLMTGKETAIPAGVVVPKTATEKDATRYYNTRVAQATQKPVTPEETAFADAYEKQHPTEATKQKDAIIKLNVTSNNTEGRAVNARLEAAKTKLTTDLQAEDTKARDSIERIQRAKSVMADPNFLTNVLQTPEILQIVAGGMGSGLRMTTAELNNVQQAQTGIETLKGRLAKATGLGEQTTIGHELQAQMQKIVAQVEAAALRREKTRVDIEKRNATATDSGDVNDLRAEWWQKRDEEPSSAKPSAQDLIKKYGGKR